MRANVWKNSKKTPCNGCGKDVKHNQYGTVPRHKCPHGKWCQGKHGNMCQECAKRLGMLADVRAVLEKGEL